MNLKINKAILRVWRKSYANSPLVNEPYINDLTQFDKRIQKYLLWTVWEQVNIMLRI